jgi:hypothetical protein
VRRLQNIKRHGDLLELVAQQDGELLAPHQGALMPGKEDEEVQIARMPHHLVDLGEQPAGTVHVILQGARLKRRKRRIL